VCTALAVAALAVLGLVGSASAKLTGELALFQQCPWTNTEVKRCLHSLTESGEVVLGDKKVPIVSPVTLQGGYGKAVEKIAPFFAATNGVTLSKTPQSIPGGLFGIVPPEKSPPLVKALSKFFFENSLTGVKATLELAKPASEIRISEVHLAESKEVALKLPVMAHLENPFLGRSCFVGSSTSPITLELTSGATTTPPPNSSITGGVGFFEIAEGGKVLRNKGAKLVDNAWSAPKAAGCGGIFSFLVNPIINAQLGTTTAGHNTAILVSTLSIATSAAAKENNEENP
jgi:hypothetical protein